ncbi:MAG TPA: dienelactone hydrolase family protein [Polyangiaceae bacterium]|jgi:carboxymethylenebutenolidase|nr:dienelactone hydrolase family protein [Polyangiaceae bacterium]
MGEMIEFARPDGKTCPAYLAMPKGGESAPGLVVIQEYWGLNPQIKRTGDRFAAEGFRALVPDLFRGKIASDSTEASHLMTGLNFGDAATQDIRGALDHLKKTSKKVGAIGFCMGGALVIITGVKVPGLDAGVVFYGMPPKEFADPGKITIPMQYHYANLDDWCTPERVNDVEQSVKAGKAPHELFRYEAHHAFMNDTRPEVYVADLAKTAWERSVKFLREQLA